MPLVVLLIFMVPELLWECSKHDKCGASKIQPTVSEDRPTGGPAQKNNLNSPYRLHYLVSTLVLLQRHDAKTFFVMGYNVTNAVYM